MGEGYGGLKLWTPGFMRNLYGRSSSYGRWSADVLGTLMPPGLYSVLGEGSAVNGRVAAMGSPTPELVQRCMKSVCERERERAMRACTFECYSRCSADVFATLMLRFAQICLSTVQTEALPLLKLRCPGLIQMCRDESHLHVFACAERRQKEKKREETSREETRREEKGREEK